MISSGTWLVKHHDLIIFQKNSSNRFGAQFIYNALGTNTVFNTFLVFVPRTHRTMAIRRSKFPHASCSNPHTVHHITIQKNAFQIISSHMSIVLHPVPLFSPVYRWFISHTSIYGKWPMYRYLLKMDIFQFATFSPQFSRLQHPHQVTARDAAGASKT